MDQNTQDPTHTCAICGKEIKESEAKEYIQNKVLVIWLCADSCWNKRGRFDWEGRTNDCPYFDEGMCSKTPGMVCSLGTSAQSYRECYVAGMNL